MVLGEILNWNAKRHPHKVAIVFGEDQYTFRQLLERVNRLSNGFLYMGLIKGDRVALLAQNCPQHIEIFFAAAKAGLILVEIGFRSSREEILFKVNNSGPRLLIFSRDYKDQIRFLAPEMTGVEKYICIEEGSDSTMYYEDFIKSSFASEPPVPLATEETDDITIIYTSGSTGKPKGVCQTHKKWISGAINQVCGLTITENDISLITVPMDHLAGIWPFLSHFYIGGSVVILKGFDPSKVMETVEKEKITTLNLVPTHLFDLLEVMKKKQYDTSSLKTIIYGAAPMPIELLNRCVNAFGDIFTHTYGLTEGTGGVTNFRIRSYDLGGDPKELRRCSFSCGKAGINVEVRIVNDEGNDVQPGEIGEIIVRGDCFMEGYWKLPEETEQVLKDGWIYTGDLATIDEDGYIFITDRKGFKIISGGENIYPREVEDIIYQHPAVREVAVVGVPHQRWGQAVKAVVLLHEGATATKDEIIKFCKKRMAGYKCPKTVDFVSELPKSSVGKILKEEIKKWY